MDGIVNAFNQAMTWMLAIGLPAFGVFFGVRAFQLMKGGRDDVEGAKKGMEHAVIGAILLIGAKALTSYVWTKIHF
ncbi:pilin [Lacticaseibacillus sharpeae]|uniref:Uncharacterized protein n=1 Tax=Lacticaseibacillus sharpeae JCM 1186 = DSM 20505 TaxID=1291052 RepID=A0A0R1ZXQ4_9LACO|nr:pilin [Lacticaseibacillus sharpeae]KRM56649.1 hypothetical protein FC18_GL001782 [Lacticaseibacillus sharpeae JCM 1186 = DSM 20505]